MDGYFEDGVPAEFWRLLLLYLCVNQLSSLPWARPFGESVVRTMREQAKRVLDWYADGIVPSWYERS